MEQLQKMRNDFEELVNILDELIELGYRAENGERDLEEKIKSKYGYFYYKLLELSKKYN